MARALRVQVEGGVYHVTTRGNAREPIFLCDPDREAFLGELARATSRYGVLVHAYCLMGNHYHLLIETPRANLSRALHQVNGAYAEGFNRRHLRVGHVFQGRYKAILVEKEPHLLELCRYVVLNPVRAGLCSHPGDWPWSSYRAMVGEVPCPSFLTLEWVLAQFGKERRGAEARFRVFVEEGDECDPWRSLRGRIYLGSENFVRRHAASSAETEIARAERQPLRPSLAELFDHEGDRGLAVAYRQWGYRLSDIAEHLRIHVSTASRRLRRLEARDDA